LIRWEGKKSERIVVFVCQWVEDSRQNCVDVLEEGMLKKSSKCCSLSSEVKKSKMVVMFACKSLEGKKKMSCGGLGERCAGRGGDKGESK
jgi:hypothetical protein